MTDDATNWVTVKVPEEDREQADEYRPDGTTWGDCLVAGADRLNDTQGTDMSHLLPPEGAESIAEHLEDALDSASMAAVPGAEEGAAEELLAEIRKAQELAEQARDAAEDAKTAAEVAQR